MVLRWKPAKRGIAQKLEPVAADYALAPIPQTLWPAYYLVKPVRLLIEKLSGRRTADRLGLKSGSFNLGTPHVLLEPLFDHVGLSTDDTIVDLGCGDGRILISAAKHTGCKAKGVEQNAALVDEARHAADAAGVGYLVEVSQGSALNYPLDDASVVFMFLPKALLPVILATAQESAQPGTRMLAHEQHQLDIDSLHAARVNSAHSKAVAAYKLRPYDGFCQVQLTPGNPAMADGSILSSQLSNVTVNHLTCTHDELLTKPAYSLAIASLLIKELRNR